MNKNKLLTIIVSIVIVIQIAILITLIIYKKDDNQYEIVSPSSKTYIENVEDLTIINPSQFLSLNVGNIKKADIIHVVNDYITVILPKIYSVISNPTDNLTAEFYTNNQEEFNKYGITSFDRIQQIEQKIIDSKANIRKYKTIEFISSSFEGKYTIISCKVTYENNVTVNMNINYYCDNFNSITIQ